MSAVEIREMVKNVDPNVIAYMTYAMKEKQVTPTTVLIYTAEFANNSYGLALMALALRYGANPNVYIDMPKVGQIHALGFIAKNKEKYDPKIFVLIIAMLIISGAKVNSPMFNQTQSLVRDEPVEAISVADWYYKNNLGNELIELSSEGVVNKINPKIRSDLGALLDNLEYLPEPTIEDMELAVLSQSSNVISRFIYNSRTSNVNLVAFYDWVIKYYATGLTRDLLRNKIYPRYYQVNNVILKMRIVSNNKTVKDPNVLVLQLQTILKDMVIAGTNMDLNQETILKAVSPNVHKIIVDAYKQPYWKKICSTETVTPRLLSLATALQYNGSVNNGTEVCTFIKHVSEADPNQVIKAATERQRERIAVNNSSATDFIGTKPQRSVCYNTGISGDEIYEYADMDLATYKDDEGRVYCFTKDMFPLLVKEAKNPYNGKALPSSFLENVKKQQSILQSLGLTSPSEPISSGVRRLTAPDTITNDITQEYINDFKQLADKYRVNAQSISMQTMSLLLTILGFNNIDLNMLSEEHAHATFVITVMETFKQDPSKIQPFFEYLKLSYTQ